VADYKAKPRGRGGKDGSAAGGEVGKGRIGATAAEKILSDPRSHIQGFQCLPTTLPIPNNRSSLHQAWCANNKLPYMPPDELSSELDYARDLTDDTCKIDKIAGQLQWLADFKQRWEKV
jgi:hypothetical protein